MVRVHGHPQMNFGFLLKLVLVSITIYGLIFLIANWQFIDFQWIEGGVCNHEVVGIRFQGRILVQIKSACDPGSMI